VISGEASIASATMVPVGFTAYGWDSEPTYSAPISLGSTSHRLIMLRAAATLMVMTSSSGDGTLLL